MEYHPVWMLRSLGEAEQQLQRDAAFASQILGFAACILGFKRHPDLALFGFLVVFLSFTSGPAQGMHRYILGAPPVFLWLARLGRSKPFDNAWTIGSTLLMGMMATLFMFDFWAG